jgi:hypothetical protein
VARSMYGWFVDQLEQVIRKYMLDAMPPGLS